MDFRKEYLMHGNKIRLRALEPSDAGTVYEWENDPSVWKFGDRRWPVSLSDVKSLIERSDLDIWQTRQMRFMIDSLEDGRSVGCVDIYDFDPLNMHCSLGVLVESGSRGNGFAREAVALVENFAREVLVAHSINVTVAADNEPSVALFQAAGYERVGVMKDNLRRDRMFVDEVLLQKVFTD